MGTAAAVTGTFAIVARDLQSGQLGVAVQSKFLAVGSQCPAAVAGLGAVSAHVWFNRAYREQALRLLEQGRSAQEVVGALVEADPERNVAQVAVVDRHGRAAAHTGKHCFPWAGQVVGDGFACLGNVLAGNSVVEAMANAFLRGSGDLPGRLVAALAGGHAAGGDWRGRESAVLLVVGGEADSQLSSVDFRVDHHADPIGELERLLTVRSERFPWKRATTARIEGDIVMVIQVALRTLGYYHEPFTWVWDASTRQALQRFLDEAGLQEAGLDRDIISLDNLTVLRRRYALAK